MLSSKIAPIPVTIDGKLAAGQISRRQAMQWVIASLGVASLPPLAGDLLAQEVGRTNAPQEKAAQQPNPDPTARGYGVDPVLAKNYKPGDVWTLTFTESQKKAAKALADTIIPKDDLGPAASEVGVVEMLDEWVSAPYPKQLADRPKVLALLEWIDAESAKRFATAAARPVFADLKANQQTAICDDICYAKLAKKEFKASASNFELFRSLAAGAYYATPEGWKAIGYVGNVALPSFDGPPAEVLEKLGVTQTVK